MMNLAFLAWEVVCCDTDCKITDLIVQLFAIMMKRSDKRDLAVAIDCNFSIQISRHIAPCYWVATRCIRIETDLIPTCRYKVVSLFIYAKHVISDPFAAYRDQIK